MHQADHDGEDRRDRGDAGDPERRTAAGRRCRDPEQERAHEDGGEHERSGNERPASRRAAPEAHGGTGLECPVRELGDREQPSRDEARSRIDPLADEGDRVAADDECERGRHQTTTAKNEAGEERGHASNRDNAGELRGVHSRQTEGEREQRRSCNGGDTGDYARIALA